MAENPLLPHHRLKELYDLMKRLHSLGGARRAEADREAVLAAAAIQLEPGDILCGTQGSTALFALPGNRKSKVADVPKRGAIHTCALRDTDVPALCEVLALGLKAAEMSNCAIGLASTASAAEWSTVLQHAQEERLPLLLIITDRPSSASSTTSADMTWTSMSKLAKKLQLPTISVDGEDAVAIYRVVQESLHRAKHGDGPVIIWCSYTSRSAPAGSSRSIVTMESYLSARGLLPNGKRNKRTVARE